MIRFAATLFCGIACPAVAQTVTATQAEVDAYINADRNQNGLIERSEFKSFMDAIAATGQGTAQTVQFFAAYDYAFDYIDADGNGVLSPIELRSAETAYEAEN